MNLSGAADTFTRALQAYTRGALLEADADLAVLLERTPRHFDALHLRGLVASRRDRLEQAEQLMRQALAVDSTVAAAHRHLGNVLQRRGRPEEALASFTRAIECRQEFKEAYVNRAMTLLRLRRAALALEDFDRAIALGADDVQVHLYRASALIDLARPEEALVDCERAMQLDPRNPDVYLNLGIAQYLLARHLDAAAACGRAIEFAPNHAGAHGHRGAALYALGCLQEALSCLDTALAIDPHNAFALKVRALCLLDLQRPEEALDSCDRAIALRADLADAYNTRGLALADLLRFDAAAASFARAIALQPHVREPYFNKGVRCLQAGDFETGWELYEMRPLPAATALTPAAPVWDGTQPIAGMTLWVNSEQGLGDTLQFCRYAGLLEERGARVILSVQDNLCALLQTLSTGIEVVGSTHIPPDVDFRCPLLSLPRAFRTRPDDIPARVPYLHPEPSRVTRWRERLQGRGRLIGIRWQGSTGRADAGRSFHVRHFEKIAALPGIRLVSLQKGAGAEQLGGLPASLQIQDLGTDFEPGGPDAFLDVAAVMECLDLVITSDTSIAHLAGALGRPTWVALKRVPDWRWMLDRDDSPWYPTMRLFRQRRHGDWEDVFDRMRVALLEGL
jgi:tetratricopeptide (TPR) repeat protein